jgi:hypothetical protein
VIVVLRPLIHRSPIDDVSYKIDYVRMIQEHVYYIGGEDARAVVHPDGRIFLIMTGSALRPLFRTW